MSANKLERCDDRRFRCVDGDQVDQQGGESERGGEWKRASSQSMRMPVCTPSCSSLKTFIHSLRKGGIKAPSSLTDCFKTHCQTCTLDFSTFE